MKLVEGIEAEPFFESEEAAERWREWYRSEVGPELEKNRQRRMREQSLLGPQVVGCEILF